MCLITEEATLVHSSEQVCNKDSSKLTKVQVPSKVCCELATSWGPGTQNQTMINFVRQYCFYLAC
jgi:hypothetical protein